jgi:glycosyltransferase involved in cell wall biosynthesis
MIEGEQHGPLVSIIIPCWNCESFVGQAIESAIAQTYRNIEIIVIDDGSTDESLEVIKSYGQRILWETGPNRGACAARNRGFAISQGGLLQFLDADDHLHPDKILQQVEYMNGYGLDSVFCNALVVPVSSPSESHEWYHATDEDAVCAAFGSNAGTSTGLHRRRFVHQAGGFDETLPCAQERDFHLRLACLGARFGVLPIVLVTLFRRPGSISANYVRVIDQYQIIVSRAWQILEARGELSEHRARAASAFLAGAAAQYAKLGHYDQAKHYLSQSTLYHPSYGSRVAVLLSRLLVPLARFLGHRSTAKAFAMFARFR